MECKSFHFGSREVKLNEDQYQVVIADFDKNICVIACAGSGKTTTVLCRIKHLIDNGVSSSEIILTTFTRDATHDMINKLKSILDPEDQIGITVGTIDALGLRILREYCPDEISANGIYNVI